jgi:hypothetical protein
MDKNILVCFLFSISIICINCFASDYKKISCKIQGYEIKDVVEPISSTATATEYEPLLQVDLIFTDKIKYYKDGKYLARKSMMEENSDFVGESDAKKWAQKFIIDNVFTCYYEDDTDICIEKPNDTDWILPLTGLVGVLLFVFCVLCLVGLCFLCCSTCNIIGGGILIVESKFKKSHKAKYTSLN